MTLAPLAISDSLNVIVSTKSFPISVPQTYNSSTREASLTILERDRDKKGTESTFADELLATREDVGERLEKGLEVSNRGFRRKRDRNRSPAKFDSDSDAGAPGLRIASFTSGITRSLHFPFPALLALQFLFFRSQRGPLYCRKARTGGPQLVLCFFFSHF